MHPNQRVTLSVGIAVNPKMHVHAPGVEGYFAIDWKTQQTPAARFEAVKLSRRAEASPRSHQRDRAAYVDSLRLAEDIVISSEANVKPLLNEKGELILHGTLRYQACDNRVRYIPATVLLNGPPVSSHSTECMSLRSSSARQNDRALASPSSCFTSLTRGETGFGTTP